MNKFTLGIVLVLAAFTGVSYYFGGLVLVGCGLISLALFTGVAALAIGSFDADVAPEDAEYDRENQWKYGR